MAEKMITYFGKPARVACDELCSKAWGINNRPKVQLSDDEDDYEYLADNELPEAPEDPGTYEGGDGKPTSAIYFPNKWCVRECERCTMTPPEHPNDVLVLPDFSKRVQNIPSRRKAQQSAQASGPEPGERIEQFAWSDLRVVSAANGDVHIKQDSDIVVVTGAALEVFIAALRKVAAGGKPETEEEAE